MPKGTPRWWIEAEYPQLSQKCYAAPLRCSIISHRAQFLPQTGIRDATCQQILELIQGDRPHTRAPKAIFSCYSRAALPAAMAVRAVDPPTASHLSLIHISEPTRRTPISYA